MALRPELPRFGSARSCETVGCILPERLLGSARVDGIEGSMSGYHCMPRVHADVSGLVVVEDPINASEECTVFA